MGNTSYERIGGSLLEPSRASRHGQTSYCMERRWFTRWRKRQMFWYKTPSYVRCSMEPKVTAQHYLRFICVKAQGMCMALPRRDRQRDVRWKSCARTSTFCVWVPRSIKISQISTACQPLVWSIPVFLMIYLTFLQHCNFDHPRR